MKFLIGDIVQHKTTCKVGVVMEAINKGSRYGWHYKIQWIHNQKITTPSQSILSFVRTTNNVK